MALAHGLLRSLADDTGFAGKTALSKDTESNIVTPSRCGRLAARPRPSVLDRRQHPAGARLATFTAVKTLARHLLLTCGWLSLGVGALGLLVPVLPTAPFVLLAAACFLRSSERLHHWLISHPTFGCHVEDYLAGRGLQARTKVVALTTLWMSVLASAYFFVPLLAVDLLLIAIAASVSVYLLRLPTCELRKEHS